MIVVREWIMGIGECRSLIIIGIVLVFDIFVRILVWFLMLYRIEFVRDWSFVFLSLRRLIRVGIFFVCRIDF